MRKKKSTVEKTGKTLNVLGMLPLDMGNKGNSDRILTWLKEGYKISSDFAMGLSIEQIKNCPDADLNLVVARSGLAAARFLEKKYGIPYICGLPLGDGAELKGRLEKQERFQPLPEAQSDKKGILIIHEQIFANELRVLLSKKTDVPITVGSLFGRRRTESFSGFQSS
ncbi:MAG: nitrogenase component 1 [Lachnospiraceae bacterium]